MSHPLDVRTSDFEQEVLRSELPVLVDFWGPDCPPCRVVGPIVSALAEELTGRLKVVKVDASDATDLAGRYGIMGLPTLLVFKGGHIVATLVGSQSRQAIMGKVQPYLD
jgi:thioredoxin 1